MTSWPNIPKGLRRGMRAPSRRYTGQSVAGRGPYPCKYPGCELGYTPGYYKEHARSYHRPEDLPRRPNMGGWR